MDYEGVSAEVMDIFSYQEVGFNRRLNRWVMTLTIGALIVGFFGMNPLFDLSKLHPLMGVLKDYGLFFHLTGLLLLGAGIVGFIGITYSFGHFFSRRLFEFFKKL